MASRPGARSNGNDQDRPRDANEEFPPLPETTAPSRAPTLRRSLVPATTFELPPSQTTTSRFARRMPYSTAAQRAERIRHLDDLPQPIPEQFRLEQSREPFQGRDPRELSVSDRWIFARRVPRVRAVPPPPPQPLPPPLPPPDLQEIDQSLDEANATQLRSLLDMTNHINLMTPLLSSSISHMPSSNVPSHNVPTYDVPFPNVSTTPFNIPPPSRSHDFEHNIRSKRRKIDSNHLVPSFKAFYYGRFGQVEPGKLQMELLSCDGGTFSTQSAYSAENILKDDDSVYCTRGNRCNIVLRHQGATVFTLEKLTIKAPKSANYSHPVREGMVFIAMNQDDELSRTAKYQVHHARPANGRSRNSIGPDSTNSSDPPTQRHGISIRHNGDGTLSTHVRGSIPTSREGGDNDREHRLPSMPDEFLMSQPDFHITTDCASDEDDNLLISRSSRPPDRIGSLPFENEIYFAADLTDGTPSEFGFTESFHRQLPSVPQFIDPRDAEDIEREREAELIYHFRPAVAPARARVTRRSVMREADHATDHVTEGKLLVPHAKFLIERKKSKCTIHFDPPVSGRFILLKVWSPSHDSLSNIDIQSVVAKGFAGTRYFPSTQLS